MNRFVSDKKQNKHWASRFSLSYSTCFSVVCFTNICDDIFVDEFLGTSSSFNKSISTQWCRESDFWSICEETWCQCMQTTYFTTEIEPSKERWQNYNTSKFKSTHTVHTNAQKKDMFAYLSHHWALPWALLVLWLGLEKHDIKHRHWWQ